MRPATVGATTVDQPFVQTNIVGPATADDGSPAGYPRDENDSGLVVMRVDGTDGVPIATWVNYAQHPEGLDGYDLTSQDFLAPLRRYVERETGAPLVFSQGAVGSSEGPYEGYYPRGAEPRYPSGPSAGVVRAFAHVGHAQVERAGPHPRRLRPRGLARDRRRRPGGAGAGAPRTSRSRWSPTGSPVRSATRTRASATAAPTPRVDGDPGVGHGARLRAGPGQGFPTPPATRSTSRCAAWASRCRTTTAPASFSAVEENMRIKLQAVRIGDVLLASCSCEAQVDLIKNLESRLDDVEGNQYLGYEYPCVPAGAGWTCTQADPRAAGGARTFDPHRRGVPADAGAGAQRRGRLGGPGLRARRPSPSRPTRPLVKGNFTHTELTAAQGFPLVVGLGHTGDYDGYIVSYREFQSRESYRKALTSYGPHSADYMNTHLLDLARFLRDGTAIPAVPEPGAGRRRRGAPGGRGAGPRARSRRTTTTAGTPPAPTTSARWPRSSSPP